MGDDYQIRLNELATKVDRSLFPQFKECDRIMQEYPRCVNLQTTRKASYEAYVANEQDDARMRAQSAVGAAQYWGS